MAGLDYASTVDDGADDTDLSDGGLGASPLAGASRGALQKYVDAASDTSGIHSALSQVAQALKADRRQNQIQALFAAAGALGSPTRTGSIGETAATLGKTLSETMGTQNAADRQGAATAAKLQLDEAKAELASKRALGVQAMKAMGANGQSPAMKMLGKVVLGAPDPRTGAQQAYRYVEDPRNPGQLTYQVIPIETARSLLAKQNATAAPAYMPTESDIDPKTGQIAAPPAAEAAVPGADGALPMRPVDENPTPLKGVTGTPAELEAKYGLKAKGIDLTGLDPNTPVFVNMDTGKPEAIPAIDPLSKYNGLTGQPLLDALSPADRNEVQAIHDGRLLAPVTGTRAKEGARLLALTTAAYPDFDAGIAKAKFATRAAFAPSGKVGQNFASIDTVLNHLEKYAQGVEDINNIGGLGTSLNPVKNLILKRTGHASPTNLDTEATAVSTELMKAFRSGTGAGSTREIQEWRKTVDPDASPDQQAGTIKTGVGLVVGRLEPLVSQWNQAMGENRSVLSFVSPKARASLMKLDPSFQLTDDDKAYLATQELSKRKTGTLSLPAKAAAPGPSSAAGGKALPASTLSQYAAVPMANKAAARAHLQSLGYDISGLK